MDQELMLENQDAQAQAPAITDGVIIEWLNSKVNEKKLNSLLQPRVDQAIGNWKTNNLARIVDDEITKRFPPETEEAKQLKELKDVVTELQTREVKAQRRADTISALASKGLPTELADFAISDDDETTRTKLERLVNLIDSTKTAAVSSALASDTAKPAGVGGQITPRVELEARMAVAVEKRDLPTQIALERQLSELNNKG